eukprot:7504386-Pyramimonas_sp.AAC.1
MSEYYNTNVLVSEAHGQEPRGDPLGDDVVLELYAWIHVRKEAPAPVPPPRVEDPWAAANVPIITAHVCLHDLHQWKAIELPNREGPTQDRLFVSIMMLKKAAMEEWGYGEMTREQIREIKVYYNVAGVPKLPLKGNNERVIDNK